jgi:hypothetical protein
MRRRCPCGLLATAGERCANGHQTLAVTPPDDSMRLWPGTTFNTLTLRRMGRSKLTPDQVRDIRRLAADGTSRRSLATLFGTCVENVKMIVNRQSWTHI